MKRRIHICLLCLLCLLTACGQREEAAATAWSPGQMVQAILDSQELPVMPSGVLLYGDALFDTYLADYYGLNPEDVADGAIAYAGGVEALEVAVLRLTEDADGAARTLDEYIDARAGAFAGYAPEQYAIVEASGTASRGQYAALLICPDLDAAREAFDACFTSDPPEPQPEPIQSEPLPSAEEEQSAPAEPEEPVEPDPADVPADEADPRETEPEPAESEPEPAESEPEPEEPAPEPEPEPEMPWSYSEQRILDAWNSGSRDGLWEQDVAILEVLEGIPALTDESLTDYERELALHDWMIAWAEYDPGALSSGPIGSPMPDNDNPYGFLTGRKGICLGYTSTFQLLMDLSGIECLSADGATHGGASAHAWNLVKLDGEWYIVDTTWDDPVASFQVSASTAHLYFNVTDDFLRQHDHQWDESSVPAAEGTAWAWKG